MITGTTALAAHRALRNEGREVVYRVESARVTVEQLRERLADAADTLRRLPKPRGLERSLQSPWPDTLREWLSYGYDRTRVRRSAPAPQAIDRLDEVLEWIGPNHLTPAQRMVLWAREGEHMRWKRIEFLDAQMHRGLPRRTRQLQNIKADAEARILNRLNGTPQRMRINFPGGRLAVRDEGRDWVSLDLYEQDGSSLSVRVPRQVLPPYALVLLATGLRKT